MGTTVYPSDLTTDFRGPTKFASLILPSACVANAQIAETITYDKQQQLYRAFYSQTGTAASATIPIHEVRGATAQVLEVRAGSVVLNIGAATVTVDIKKNGTTILTAVITLDTANTAYISEGGTLSGTPTAVAGDVYTAVIVATAGGGTLATGLWVSVRIKEDPA